MAPILGILASGRPRVKTSYESIASTTLGSASSVITFSSIPSTYKHLQLRIWGYNNSGSDRSLEMRLNNDSGANYVDHFLLSNNTSAPFAGGVTGRTAAYTFDTNTVQRGFNGDPAKASAFIIDIHDYQSTTKNKTIKAFGGWDGNGSGWVGLASNLWLSTAAVNRIDLSVPFSTLLQPGTIMSLYGIKG
jgi:hypothetical protein